MPRKPKPASEPLPETTFREEPYFDQDEASLQEAAETFGSDNEVKFKVHRVLQNGLEFKYAGSWSEVNREPEMWLQQRFPEGGEFQITLVSPNGMQTRRRVLIGAAAASSALPSGGGPFDVTKALFERMDRLEQRLTSNTLAGPPGSMADMVQALVALDNLRGQKQDTGEAFFKMFETVMSIKREVTGDKEGGSLDWLKDLAREVLPVVAAGLRGGGVRNEPVAAAPPRAAIPGETGGGTVLKDVPDEALKEGIRFLKTMALRGADPGVYVQMIADNAENYEPLIRAAVDRKLEDFASIDPEITGGLYRPFFEEFFDGLRSIAPESNNLGTNSNGSTGNGANTSKNGKPSKGSKSV